MKFSNHLTTNYFLSHNPSTVDTLHARVIIKLILKHSEVCNYTFSKCIIILPLSANVIIAIKPTLSNALRVKYSEINSRIDHASYCIFQTFDSKITCRETLVDWKHHVLRIVADLVPKCRALILRAIHEKFHVCHIKCITITIHLIVFTTESCTELTLVLQTNRATVNLSLM